MEVVRSGVCMADGTTGQHGELPKISVVTPSYNQGQFLEQTIQSVLDQDYPNLEYIIMDGGSTDSSVDIIKRYEDGLAYWVSEPDEGQPDAINRGFRIATGDILAWLNSDDVYLPGALSRVATYFQAHPEIGCTSGDIVMIDQAGETLYSRKVIPFQFRMALYGACMVPQPSTFWTKEAWEKAGGVDPGVHYQTDFDFFLRMASQGVKFGIIRELLAAFRLHATSKTVSEYTGRVAQANLIIRRRYSDLRFHNECIENTTFTTLKWIYRAKGFLIRAVTRGDCVPFKGVVARRSVRKA